MLKNFSFIVTCIVLAAILAAGCRPHSSTGPETSTSPGYFQTSFQDESQYIVEAVVSDLAEQMFYAASHQLPDPKYFLVTASEKPDSPHDAPVYELQIRLDPKQGVL